MSGTSGLGVSTYLGKALTASAGGDNTIHTPASGKSIRLHYICLSADGANTADVVCTVKYAGASSLYLVSLTPKALWARNIGAGRHYFQGSVDASLLVSLSSSQSVHTSIEYEEV